MAVVGHDGHVFFLLVNILSTKLWRNAALLLTATAACVVGGGALFAFTQNLPVTTGLYWAITTATTVGYGDVTPHTASGRVVASAVMLTTIPMLAAAFAMITAGSAATAIRRVMAMDTHFPEDDYRLVVGMNSTIPTVLDELAEVGVPVVLAADVDPASVRRGVHVVRGDPTQPATIKAARPAGAQHALIAGNSDSDVLVCAVIVRKHAPDLPVTALVNSAAVREALLELGIQRTVSAEHLLANTLTTSLETPHAGDMVTQLLEVNQHKLVEAEVDPAAVGKPLSALRRESATLILGLVHGDAFSLGLGDDPVVAAGDFLLTAEPAPEHHRFRHHHRPAAGADEGAGFR